MDTTFLTAASAEEEEYVEEGDQDERIQDEEVGVEAFVCKDKE